MCLLTALCNQSTLSDKSYISILRGTKYRESSLIVQEKQHNVCGHGFYYEDRTQEITTQTPSLKSESWSSNQMCSPRAQVSSPRLDVTVTSPMNEGEISLAPLWKVSSISVQKLWRLVAVNVVPLQDKSYPKAVDVGGLCPGVAAPDPCIWHLK
jgi:hypothetical protein